jgi:PKD repeat protein
MRVCYTHFWRRVLGLSLLLLAVATTDAAHAAASQIAVNAGNNQFAAAGAAVAVLPSVLVTDSGGNPVAGVTVTFTLTSGGGSITGAAPMSDASGIATLGSWTLGAAPGGNSLDATATGLTGSPLQFTATGTGPAATIQVYLGNNQSAPVGSNVLFPPCVIVKDSGGTAVANVPVTFAVTGGGGIAIGLSQFTNAGGIAIVGSWTLGTTPGANTLSATSAGLSGSPVIFTATATSPLAFISGPTATPAFASIGQVVTFSATSNEDKTTFSWNFGDGSSDTSGSATVQHAYVATGTYSVSVTATSAVNGGQVNTATTAVAVYQAIPLMVTRKTLRAANPSLGKDSVQLQGSITLPDGTTQLPQSASVSFGSARQTFSLTRGAGRSGQSSISLKGTAKKGVLLSTTVTFKTKLTGNLLSVLTSAGLTAGSSGTVTVPVQIIFTQTTFAASGSVDIAVNSKGKVITGK